MQTPSTKLKRKTKLGGFSPQVNYAGSVKYPQHMIKIFLFKIKNYIKFYQTDWSEGNSIGFYFGGAWFKSQPEH
jgi:hypothetical protein